MKKKGFTLIELLAVIVILAIIALIATPLVLKYIEKSRKESKVDSAYAYVRNLETEIANYAIKNNGKKYTTDKENIKELGLDITVKGENPEDGKVCISSVGQIEKGVFQYGKYYVSYDGKKGSIIDEDTYNSFSCGDSNLEFECNESGVCLANLTDEDSDKLFNEIKNATYYNITIGNQSVNRLFSVISLDDSAFDDDVIYFRDGYDDWRACLALSHKMFIVVTEGSFEAGKKYSGKLEESSDKAIRHVMRINSSPYTNLYSYDFVEGDAHVLIKDSDSVEYLNINTQFESMGYTGLYGTRFVDVDYDEELKNVYNAMAEGKIITVTVTQVVDGKEVVTVIGGIAPSYDGSQYYYLGNNVIYHLD